MGHQVVAGTSTESLTDKVWLDLIALASKHSFSAPRLSLLGRREDAELSDEEAAGLRAALERALSVGNPANASRPRTKRWTATQLVAWSTCYARRVSR